MNNQQFRRLLLDNGSASPGSGGGGASATPRRPSGATPALGSRVRASIPMTPRNVGGTASEIFARQLKEQRQEKDGQQQQKRFRASAAPKGTKLASGYTDRAYLRGGDDAADDKAERVKALEEMVKLGQMDQAQFEKVRDEIIGGDIRNVHLVKGLDRRLLARARAGEDVYNATSKDKAVEEAGNLPADVDDEFEDLESQDVKPVEREQRDKQGSMAPPPAPISGRKRTRDDIIREMKEARLKAVQEAKAAQPELGSHFKRIVTKNQPGTSRIEIDEHGREVLIVVDAQGNVKRKVKKQKSNANEPLPMPDKSMKPLGMEVPENTKATPVEEESDDIFADAGSDYNPLGDIDDDDTSESDLSEKEADKVKVDTRQDVDENAEPSATTPLSPSREEAGPSKRRNYFGEDSTGGDARPSNPLADPSILSAIKRASASNAASSASEHQQDIGTEAARTARLRDKLASQDRDAYDMDMGFGSSRYDDQDDGEQRSFKLAKWAGLGADNNDDGDRGRGSRGGQSQRKRGKKKKKGDKNDASTVLGVIERRKAG